MIGQDSDVDDMKTINAGMYSKQLVRAARRLSHGHWNMLCAVLLGRASGTPGRLFDAAMVCLVQCTLAGVAAFVRLVLLTERSGAVVVHLGTGSGPAPTTRHTANRDGCACDVFTATTGSIHQPVRRDQHVYGPRCHTEIGGTSACSSIHEN